MLVGGGLFCLLYAREWTRILDVAVGVLRSCCLFLCVVGLGREHKVTVMGCL